MKLPLKKLLLVFFFAVSFSNYTAAEMVGSYSDDDLIQIIKDDGYGAVSKIKDGAIHIKIEGRSYILLNKSDGDLQAYYSLTGVALTSDDMNEWNRTKRLSRAYLDSSLDPVLESDLLANGGLSVKHVTEFFRIFKGSVDSFRKFVSEHNRN